MWRTVATTVFAAALGVAGAVHVHAHRVARMESGGPGWTRLANGLRYTVRPVAGATDVAVLVSFVIGSEHDPEDRVGLAHLTEHLYVTSAAGPTDAQTVEQLTAAYPQGFSATTDLRITNFLTVVGPGALDAELADAAARMADLRIEQSDLDRERPRVEEQIAEGADDGALPVALERLGTPPGVVSAGGRPADVARITLAEVRDRCARYYKPGNARLVLAGAVDAALASALVEKLFAGVPRGEPSPPAEEPRPASPGLFEVPAPPEVAAAADRLRSFCIAYRPKAAGAADFVAFLLMQRRWIETLRSPSQWPSRVVPVLTRAAARRTGMAIVGSWGDDAPVADLVAEADALVALLKKDPPSPEELRECRELFAEALPDFAFRPVADGRPVAASQLAFAAFGCIRDNPEDRPERFLAALSAMTASDLERGADTWFAPEGRVIVTKWYVPKPAPPPADSSESGLPPLHLISEVRVALTWDEATQTARRRIGDVEYPKDDDLEKAIRAAHDVWTKKGKPDVPVTINADNRVPWAEVITIVNLVKRCGIDRIEFGMGAPPKPDAGGK